MSRGQVRHKNEELLGVTSTFRGTAKPNDRLGFEIFLKAVYTILSTIAGTFVTAEGSHWIPCGMVHMHLPCAYT
ncbi:hypothetical protein D9M71_785230 [compost metagenome]